MYFTLLESNYCGPYTIYFEEPPPGRSWPYFAHYWSRLYANKQFSGQKRITNYLSSHLFLLIAIIMKLNIWKVGHNLFCSDSSNLYVSMGRITKRNFNIIQHFTVVTLFHETSSVKLKISYSLQLNVIHNS